MGVGRFICVALPLLLTIASLVAILIAGLSGIIHNNLYVFSIDVTDLSISPTDLGDIAGKLINSKARDVDIRADNKAGTNITASLLSLSNVYEITLWGYCHIDSDNKRSCEKGQFDWVNKDDTFNPDNLQKKLQDVAGTNVQLPSEIRDPLNAFRQLAKWTEVAFIIAMVALALELLAGIFATCSRGVSCLTWLVACITGVFVCAAAGLATAMGAIVVGAVKATAKIYGVNGKINTSFLATVWISAAFALGAAFFWIFTICCCKPESRSSRRATKHSDNEHLLPTRGYAPLNNDHEMSGGFYNPQQPQATGFASNAPRYPSGTGRADLAYEPYSHRA